jgi:hypothetical protein
VDVGTGGHLGLDRSPEGGLSVTGAAEADKFAHYKSRFKIPDSKILPVALATYGAVGVTFRAFLKNLANS